MLRSCSPAFPAQTHRRIFERSPRPGSQRRGRQRRARATALPSLQRRAALLIRFAENTLGTEPWSIGRPRCRRFVRACRVLHERTACGCKPALCGLLGCQTVLCYAYVDHRTRDDRFDDGNACRPRADGSTRAGGQFCRFAARPQAPSPVPTTTPAFPMPDPAQAQAMMQTFAKIGAQHRQLQAQTRAQMLAALSPAHRTLVAALVGQLAVAPNPDQAATARQLDGALSASEQQAILRGQRGCSCAGTSDGTTNAVPIFESDDARAAQRHAT